MNMGFLCRKKSLIYPISFTIGISLLVYWVFVILIKWPSAYKADIFSRNLFGGRDNTHRAHVFNASNEDKAFILEASKYQCVLLYTPVHPSRICVYPAEKDIYVSGSIIREGMWESHLVSLTESLIRRHPGMPFLDLGCNIGVFTINFARLGNRVVSVDANKLNLMLLSRSLDMNHLQKNVTLIWNAISNVHKKVTLKSVPNNIGGWYIHTVNKTNTNEIIDAITLDDLAYLFGDEKVFIKMDIEESELKALNGAKEFFKAVDVRYVLMEFMWYRHKESGKQICDLMTSYGFQPFEPQVMTQEPLNISLYSKWPIDVLWSKR